MTMPNSTIMFRLSCSYIHCLCISSMSNLQGWMTADRGLTSNQGLQMFFSSSLGMKEMWTGLRPVLVTTNLCSWGNMNRTFRNWNCREREREREKERVWVKWIYIMALVHKCAHLRFIEVHLRQCVILKFVQLPSDLFQYFLLLLCINHTNLKQSKLHYMYSATFTAQIPMCTCICINNL